MRYVLTIFTILITATQVYGYQNSYQNMWFDGIWRKDCKFDKTLQMCKSESENFKTTKDYNNYHKGVNGYYCKNGYMYRAMGYNQHLILQTMKNGMPMACTLDSTYSSEHIDKIKQLNKTKRSITW